LQKPINNGLILSIIEKGLDSLGDNSKKAIWCCLENDYGFSRTSIPENLETFQSVLEKIFGLGYSFLDALFRKYLQDATGENLQGYESFVESVQALRFKKTFCSLQAEASVGEPEIDETES
jgi:hypothetical protein